jgi:GNAT superfamily N-acetyltransferase
MLLSFRHADFDALVQLWNSYYPAEFSMDVATFKSKTVGHDLFDWGASAINVRDDEILGFVTIKRSAGDLYAGPNIDVFHLQSIAYKEADSAVDLLSHAKQVLKNRGAQALAFGMDNGHFFPGCPEEFHSLRSFLMVNGFEEGPVSFDLERDLVDYSWPKGLPEGAEFRVMRPEDVPAVTAFFDAEFPARWKFDVFNQVKIEGPQTVMAGFIGERCVGFALIQNEGAKNPIGGAVWHNSLGPNWCSLGPIGVAKDIRGMGLGDGMLAAGLLELQRRGGRRCIIDWTTLGDFYGRHGFTPTRRYVAATLQLAP